MGRSKGVRKKKCGKRARSESENNAQKKRKEELRTVYKRKRHVHKMKYKQQKIKHGILMKNNEETLSGRESS